MDEIINSTSHIPTRGKVIATLPHTTKHLIIVTDGLKYKTKMVTAGLYS